MWHALDRWIIHFFASPGVVLAATFSLAILCRKKTAWTWLPQNKKQIIVVSALAVFAVSAMREAFDVYGGQPIWKAATDYSSWLLGCGVGAWALFRLEKWQ